MKSSLALFFYLLLTTFCFGADGLLEKIAARKSFLNNHCRMNALLTAIEKKDWQEDSLSFLTPKQFYSIFKPFVGESPEEHVQRYFDCALARNQFGPPLYASNELHCPDRFFNVYGTGKKTDLAQVVASLLNRLFYVFTILGNDEHCLLKIKYDDVFHYHGLTGKKVEKPSSMPEISPDFSFSKLLPDTLVPAKSKRCYLDKLFVLATDGSLGSAFSLTNYEQRMANFVSFVTLEGEDEVTVKSYFPIVAAFIFVPQREGIKKEIEAPQVSLSLHGRSLSLPIKERIKREGGFYYDCSSMLAHLESHPQYTLSLRKLKDLQGAQLITVHPYCRANALYESKNPLHRKDVRQQSLAGKLQSRRKFLERYTNRRRLIAAVANKENHLLILKNDEQQRKRIDCSQVFPSTAHIVAKLSKKKIGRDRGLALYEYVDSRIGLIIPLYSGSHNHWASRFFSTYGCGWCDDSAFIISHLAGKLGMRGRVWALQGHMLAEAFWNDDWHILDPLFLEYVEMDGEILSLARLIELAPKEVLKNFADVILSTNDNRVLSSRCEPQIEPYIELLPGERRHFLNRPLVLVTDGHLLFRFRICNDKWSDYEKYVANQVRVIPLKSLAQKDGVATLKDYFPMGSLHIELPRQNGSSQQIGLRAGDEFPFPEVAIDGIEEEHWHGGQTLSERIRDYSVALAHLEDEPTLQIKIRNIEPLLARAPEARLVSSHVYCYRNAKNMTKVWREENVLSSLLKMKK